MLLIQYRFFFSFFFPLDIVKFVNCDTTVYLFAFNELKVPPCTRTTLYFFLVLAFFSFSVKFLIGPEHTEHTMICMQWAPFFQIINQLQIYYLLSRSPFTYILKTRSHYILNDFSGLNYYSYNKRRCSHSEFPHQRFFKVFFTTFSCTFSHINFQIPLSSSKKNPIRLLIAAVLNP